ncbi:MAG: DUF72 domain-containing protein [Candidatus Brocadiia bacterium]
MQKLDVDVPEQYRELVRVGTCSWKFDSWKGIVYDPDADYDPDDYLPDYARHFRTVEIDQWFWSLFPPGPKLPDPETARTYAESVPDDFVFTVKAPNSITLTHFYKKQPKAYREHANKPNALFLNPELLRHFLEALEPMREKLGPVMFQFEYLNKEKMPSLGAFLQQLHEFFGEAPEGCEYAIETRNPNYLRPEFFEFLRDHGLGYVFLDGYYMPRIGEVLAEHDTRTGAPCVVRLHGPTREGIEKMTGGEWNEVVQPQPEGIETAVQIVRENAEQGLETYVNANNHYEGCAPLTLQTFVWALRAAG